MLKVWTEQLEVFKVVFFPFFLRLTFKDVRSGQERRFESWRRAGQTFTSYNFKCNKKKAYKDD